LLGLVGVLGLCSCGRGPDAAPFGSSSASSSQSVSASSAAVSAPAPDDAVDIVMGDNHTCRLLRAGRVECWGSNDAGQLGDGTLGDRATPVLVKNLEDAVAIAAGWQGTCVARRDGSVWCWGRHPVWDGPEPWEHPRNVPQKLEGLAGVVSLGLARNELLTL